MPGADAVCTGLADPMTIAKRVVAGCAFLAACTRGGVAATLNPHDRAIVGEWLICIECIDPLDSLRVVASRQPASTIDALSSALADGLPRARIAKLRGAIDASYARDSGYRARVGEPALPARATYVEQRVAKYDNGYRSRGASGLGYVNLPAAKARLAAVDTLPLPPSVRAAVRYARDSLP